MRIPRAMGDLATFSTALRLNFTVSTALNKDATGGIPIIFNTRGGDATHDTTALSFATAPII